MNQITRITREQLRSWDACYSDVRIADLVPPEGIPPLDVLCHPDVPDPDKVWVLLRENVLGRPSYLECLARLVERSLARVASTDPRSVAVIAALRADAVTPAVRSAAYAAAADAASWAASWAARAASAAAWAAWAAADAAADAASSSVGWAERAAADAAAERAAQLNDIREMLSK